MRIALVNDVMAAAVAMCRGIFSKSGHNVVWIARNGAEALDPCSSDARDRPSSAVYGMPGAAAQLHAASEILALDKTGHRLTNLVVQNMKAHG
jgi:chemotaxis response regulator CheB